MITFASYTNDLFFPGLLCLYKSLVSRSGLENFRLLVLSRELSEDRVKVLNDLPEVEVIDMNELRGLGVKTGLSKKKKFNLNKLYLFTLEEYKKIVYLDADIICLGDLSSLGEIEPWAMAPNLGEHIGAPVGQRMMFNTGVMVLEPSLQTFEALVETLSAMEFGHFADQAVINYYLSSQHIPVECLHPKWNLIISNKTLNVKIYKDVIDEGVKFMHFTKLKPWSIGRGLQVEKLSSKTYLLAKDKLSRWTFREEVALWNGINDSLHINVPSSLVS